MNLDPGTKEAVERGCTCSQNLNEEGLGAYHRDSGTAMFFIAEDCPLHWRAPQEAPEQAESD